MALVDDVSTQMSAPARARSVLGVALVLLVVVLAARQLVVEPVQIATGSMRPTLRAGDHVAISHVPRPGGWDVGDVVLLRAPDGVLMVKRIVATAGQSVELRDGRLVVDGIARHEAYANPAELDSVYFGPVRVRAGQVFVLGDHRSGSLDSRVFGPVEVDDVQGAALAVVWPLDRVGVVR